MSSTNKTANYDLSQYIGTDKPTYLGDYNSDMLKIDTGLKAAADDATTAVSTANTATSTASDAATAASAATTTANTAKDTADLAKTTAESASTTAGTALSAAQAAETAAAANTITNLAPAYDSTLTYDVGDLVTYIDDQGSGKLYKCIIAVETPMEFNINYWDDVTTSEVYERKHGILNVVVADGIKTDIENITEVISVLTDDDFAYPNTITPHIRCEWTNGSYTVINFEAYVATDHQLKFSEINTLNSGSIFIVGYIANLGNGTGTEVKRLVIVQTDGTISSQDKTSTDITASGTKLILYV